ncbi:MAG: sigma-70 family RNA polymerase sigma factor [Clostridia bacterium]|nr:sigma-70 family RNA polymerase sigma factor [Clostridia bacterium]
MDDQSIIALFFARKEQAIAESEKAYGRYCMTVSMNILAREADAEECVNDTWVRAWNSIPPENPRSLKAYFGAIVRNLSLNRLRDRKNADLTLALDELEECLPAADDNETDARDLTDVINRFLGTLPKTDRCLFVGRYWYAHPIPTLAKAYGMTTNNATVRLHRIREALRTYLEERGYSI